ncbi:nucleoside hydrolase [Nocardia sp. BSTN01]|uniref:nucleoside hydrolase n=1 Tax=Nocardia sp. BSTN01 TaxID=2783665 RepID=UPI002815FBB4|nr:nucleoside hydrolase [Nocardia sp. BSTN01]
MLSSASASCDGTLTARALLPTARPGTPEATDRSPILLDTDTGGDPDDATAVTCAAHLPELAAVITADENYGERARFARHQLDLLSRPDVPVTAGADLGNTKYWVVAGITPDIIPAQPDEVLNAVHSVCAKTTGPVRWVGCGPMTNLASVLRATPGLADRLEITQMGGAINYRDPAKAEHNFRLDPDAARYVLTHARHLTLVLSDVTFTDEIALYPGHPLYQQLAAPTAPEWAALLVEHIDRWDADFGYTTKMHDPITLTVALGLPFVRLERRPITIADDGRMSVDHSEGRPVLVSTSADYPAFMGWLTRKLTNWAPIAPLAAQASPRRGARLGSGLDR